MRMWASCERTSEVEEEAVHGAADLAMTEVRTLDRIDKLSCGAQCTVDDGRELQKGDERDERREPRVRRRRRERARRRESE